MLHRRKLTNRTNDNNNNNNNNMSLAEVDSGHQTGRTHTLHKKMPSLILLIIICCAGFAHQVSADGVFDLEIVSIQRQKSDTFRQLPSACSDDNDQCLPYVHICMNESANSAANASTSSAATTATARPPSRTVLSTTECSFAAFDTTFLTRSLQYENSYEIDPSSSSDASLKFSFTFPWPDTFELNMQVFNQSSLSGSKVLVASINSTQTVRASPDQRENEWTFKEVTNAAANSSTSIRLRMRVTCSEGSYGSDCNAKCSARDDRFGHYTCGADGTMKCLDGWQGDLCTQPVCAEGCHPLNGYCEQPGQCLCRQGWNDSTCSSCMKYPGCVHGGCIEPWECLCELGWGGAVCDFDLNVCSRIAPCKNGGECLNTPGSYACRCAKGFSGTDCEVRVDNCELSPCKNGGACVSNNNTSNATSTTNRSNYTCVCPYTYTGRHCEIQAKTCDDSPCQNRGECIASSPNSVSPNGIRSSYTCLCAPGFEGSNCEVETNECASNPCNNGGSCVDEHNGFKCLCANGYTGPTCSIDIDECARTPCLNHGTCLDRVGHFFCVCPVGFSGALCQHISPQAFAASTVGNPCNDVNTNPCAHGATCEYRPHVGDLQVYCHCPKGFAGRFCETPDLNALRNSDEENLLAIGVDEIHKQASLAAHNNNVRATSSFAITIGVALACVAAVLLIFLGACGWFVFSKRRQQQRDQQYYCASTYGPAGSGAGGQTGSADSSPNISTLYSPKKAKKLSADEDDDDEEAEGGESDNKTGAADPPAVLNNNSSSGLDSAQREAILFAANTLSIMEALDKKRPISSHNRTRQLTGFDEVDGLRMQQRRAQLLLPQQNHNNSESLYACKSDYGGTNPARINNTVAANSLRRSPTSLGCANNNNVAAQYSRLTTYNNTLGRKTQQRTLLAAAAAAGRSAVPGKAANKNLILATENEHRATVMRQKQLQRQSMYNCATTTMPDILNTSSTIRRQIKNNAQEDVAQQQRHHHQPRHYRSQYSLDATSAEQPVVVAPAAEQSTTTGDANNNNVERRRARSSSHNARRRREQEPSATATGENSECLYSQVNRKAKKPSEILASPSSSPQQQHSSSSQSSSTFSTATPMLLLPIMSNSSTTSTFCCSPSSPTAAAAAAPVDQPLLYSLEEPADNNNSYQPFTSTVVTNGNGRVVNEHKFLASRL